MEAFNQSRSVLDVQKRPTAPDGVRNALWPSIGRKIDVQDHQILEFALAGSFDHALCEAISIFDSDDKAVGADAFGQFKRGVAGAWGKIQHPHAFAQARIIPKLSEGGAPGIMALAEAMRFRFIGIDREQSLRYAHALPPLSDEC
jgi:hypothetical protein